MTSATVAADNARMNRRTGWEGAEIFQIKGSAEGSMLILTESGGTRRYPLGSIRRHRVIQNGIDACRALVDDRIEELSTGEVDRYMEMWERFSGMLCRNLRAQNAERKADAARYGTDTGRRAVVRW